MSQSSPFVPAKDAGEVANLGKDEAIQYHYDNDTEFFSLWLDDTVTYSSGRWFAPLQADPIVTDLNAAQSEKLRFHLDALALKPDATLLDVGCGWGSILKRAVADYGVKRAVGLTLANDQLKHIEDLGDPRIEARLQDVFFYAPEERYDGIISIGAFEHFASPTMSKAQKIDIYSRFFEKCHAISKPKSTLSLQSIVWDHVDFDEAKTLIPETVFPNSDIPFLDEILLASNKYYFLEYVENRRDDYAQTLSAWISNLQSRKDEIIARWDHVKYDFFEDYLRTSRIAFVRRKNSLARLVLRRR